MSEPLLTPGTLVGGKYRIERLLGQGGMGVVFAALHTDLQQPVALKFLHSSALSGTAAVERFMREARAVARLKSEHVARIYDLGRDDLGNPFMVLELLEGLDLAKVLETQGPVPAGVAVEYLLQVCEALVEAHAMGIIHRDLKPHNLFLARRPNGAPLVKVLDFGIAKDVSAAAGGQLALTESQAVVGSPFYMAPEHMRSARSADARSDIWSLGVILYELLTGRVPFPGDTLTEVCIRVVSEPPTPLTSFDLDPGLVAVVLRCLEKDPASRWQTVAELASALAPFWRAGAHDDPSASAPRLPSPHFVGGSPSAPSFVSTDTSWGAPAGRVARAPAWRWVAVGAVASAAVAGVVLGMSSRPRVPNAPPPAPAELGSTALVPDPASDEPRAAPPPEGELPEPASGERATSVDALPQAAEGEPARAPIAPGRARRQAPPVAPAPAKPAPSASASAEADAGPPASASPPKPVIPVPNEAPILHP